MTTVKIMPVFSVSDDSCSSCKFHYSYAERCSAFNLPLTGVERCSICKRAEERAKLYEDLCQYVHANSMFDDSDPEAVALARRIQLLEDV